VVVHSRHHGNTAKIAEVFTGVLDARLTTPGQTNAAEVQDFDLVGFGSGIDNGRHYRELLDFAESLPRAAGRKAFIFSTCGMPVFAAGRDAVAEYAVKCHAALREKLTTRGYLVIGEFSCAGHNSNSFLRLFGGLNKDRPNADDLGNAEEFARHLKGRIGTATEPRPGLFASRPAPTREQETQPPASTESQARR
jgi:flavodoxin